MTTETKLALTEQTITKMQELIRANHDSVQFLLEGADKVGDAKIALLFRAMAADRHDFADELKKYVEWNCEEPADSGTLAGALHRAWMSFRASLNGGDPNVILIEAERAEDAIKKTYEEVLRETAGTPVNELLVRQYSVVKAGHDKVRDLRDECLNRK